jgi:hypothetical protein
LQLRSDPIKLIIGNLPKAASMFRLFSNALFAVAALAVLQCASIVQGSLLTINTQHEGTWVDAASASTSIPDDDLPVRPEKFSDFPDDDLAAGQSAFGLFGAGGGMVACSPTLFAWGMPDLQVGCVVCISQFLPRPPVYEHAKVPKCVAL